uniref:Uncharacterized protein n=1 Tax=Anguilla anguilla TaxID=7936 RepID=A0A0E9PJH3_ANGAN
MCRNLELFFCLLLWQKIKHNFHKREFMYSSSYKLLLENLTKKYWM